MSMINMNNGNTKRRATQISTNKTIYQNLIHPREPHNIEEGIRKDKKIKMNRKES
ncbi:MAG: hypothetical protein RSE41_02715 [Clostridia bacterium]